MHRGYTKRWRKRWDKHYHYDSDLWLLMDYFIDFANYRDSEVYFPNCGLIPLKRGQHIFGTPQISAFLRWDRGKTRRKLKILENIGFLSIKSTNKYSIASIINYDTYQPAEYIDDQQTGPCPTSRRPADDQQTTTPNNIKKDNKEKKDNNKSIYSLILAYLNDKTGKNYSTNSKATNRLINARLNEGFSETDFFTVIDNQCCKWLNDPKMMEYLRPQTLFGTKFESYLNNKPHPLSGKVSDKTIKNIETLKNWIPPDERQNAV